MKKSCILIVFMFLSIGIYAQEHVDFGKKKEVISPEINPDKTVTFRLEAKDAKSVTVQGDCVPEGGRLRARDRRNRRYRPER